MTLTILQPTSAADVCYLFEAVQWLAFGRIPVGYHWDNEEARTNFEHMQISPPAEEPSRPENFSDDEIGFANLPSESIYEAPNYEAWRNEGPEKIRKTEDVRLRSNNERGKEWQTELNAVVDRHRTRLLIALQTGTLVARGIKSEANGASSLELDLDGVTEKWEAVPQSAWVSENIDWKHSHLRGRLHSFHFVVLDSEQLLEVFPMDGEPAEDIKRMGTTYVLVSRRRTTVEKRGRDPLLPWDQFHVEMADRLRNNKFSSKLEAMIADMQGWAREKYNVDVSRTAMGEKVRPYHRRFFSKKERGHGDPSR